MSNNSENIKHRIIVPLIIVGATLIMLSLSGGYWLQKNAIDNSVHQRTSGVSRLFKELLSEKAALMSGQIDFLKTDKSLLSFFLAGNRASLVALTLPIFERMRAKYRITHFYFHGEDQVCFLRVHLPERHGDLIERFTMKEAVSTGKPFYGIELGPLGTFTLRMVHPWMVDGQLKGYIELGMEIQHLTELVKQVFNVELIVLIEKAFVDKAGWEAGLDILNREGDWELFHDFVVFDQTIDGSAILKDRSSLQKDGESIFIGKLKNIKYRGIIENLTDAAGQRVGKLASLVDITSEHIDLVRLTFFLVVFSLFPGSALLVFFNGYIGSIQTRLTTSRQKLLSEIEMRRQNEEALMVSEEQFRSIFENSKDAIVETDREGNLIRVNPAAMDMFALDEQDLESKNFRDFYVDPALNQTLLASISKQGFLKDYLVQLNGNGGNKMDCIMTISVKRSAEGAPTGYQGIIRDITEFRRKQVEREKLLSELQKALNEVKTLSDLIPICSHCKNVRDDKGYWNEIESYHSHHVDADLSHGICPDCAKKYYPDMNLYEE